MTVRIKVTPNAHRDEICAWEEDPLAGRILRIRLKAPPTDGKANQALLKFLAREWSVPKSSLTLRKGHTSRLKVLEIPDSLTGKL